MTTKREAERLRLLAKYGTSRHGHSIFAPSAAHRWKVCKGSLLINATSSDTAGYEAAEGTVAHSMAEVWLKYGAEPVWHIGEVHQAAAGGNMHSVTVTTEMLHHVGRFVAWCQEVPGDHYYEQRVDLSEIMPIPNQGGTADHFACEPGVLTITDLKFGTGVRVYAERNPQAMLYAAGVFLEWDWIYAFKTINIRICQPRLDVFEVYTCTRKELLAFMEETRRDADEAWSENADLTPSRKGCNFCAIEKTCTARLAQLDDIIDATFVGDDEENPDVVTSYDKADLNANHLTMLKSLTAAQQRSQEVDLTKLSTKRLAYVYMFRNHVEKFFHGIGEILLDRAEQGKTVPFFKLSQGRKRRKYKDPSSAAQQMACWFPNVTAEELQPPKLLTVAQAEKLIREKTKLPVAKIKQTLAEMVNEFSSKRGLVAIDDERPDISELEEDFEGEEDE